LASYTILRLGCSSEKLLAEVISAFSSRKQKSVFRVIRVINADY
jgi:hypothetical protein